MIQMMFITYCSHEHNKLVDEFPSPVMLKKYAYLIGLLCA